VIRLQGPPDRNLRGRLRLPGSKSISNRVLIIRALSRSDADLQGLSSARDTQVLQQLLQHPRPEYDAGPAGTTFRFLTAYLSLQPRHQILTGSERMQQRPIGILVDALRRLGADIQYLKREGYPPLRIGPPAKGFARHPSLAVPAGTSSQFISALLLIAPALPHGLDLELQGQIVSRPYIDMTLQLMRSFGAKASWTGHRITVAPAPYRPPRAFRVEADWSAAGYYYAMAALARSADLRLDGLFAESLQGDAVLAELMAPFGLHTHFEEGGIRLRPVAAALPDAFRYSFLGCPDLAQTLAVLCAALGLPARLEGLRTLRIKETDRVAALLRELGKLGIEGQGRGNDAGDEWLELKGGARLPSPPPSFNTYADHRMAMALAPLAMLGPIRIQDPAVVRKSYPEFWEHLQHLGFQLKTLSARE
jgi:3-phosphoshikimate 1-carboxyvinyltransferase